jgi:hypothetical protein
MKKVKETKAKKVKSSFDKTSSTKKGKKGDLPSKPKKGEVVFLGKFDKVPNDEISSASPSASEKNLKAAISYYRSNSKKVLGLINKEVETRMHTEFKKFKSLSEIVLPKEFVIGERGQDVFRLGNLLGDGKMMEGLKKDLQKVIEKNLKTIHFYFKDVIENSDKITYTLVCVKNDPDALRFEFEPSTVENKPREVHESYTDKKDYSEYLNREFEGIKNSKLEKKQKSKEFDDFLKTQI